MAFITDKTILKSIAQPKFLTSKPVKSLSTNKIIRASITNKKSPSVKIVAGMVKKIKIGFIVALTIPIMAATNTALKKFFTLTPSKNLAPRNTAAALIKSFTIKLMLNVLNKDKQ